jgi:cystathionine beta-lyase
LIEYLRGNRDVIMETTANIAGLSITPIEATYLAWIRVEDETIPP